jgi:hypothetical protein
MIFEKATLSDTKGSSSTTGVTVSGFALLFPDTNYPVAKLTKAELPPDPLYVIDGMIIIKSAEKQALN